MRPCVPFSNIVVQQAELPNTCLHLAGFLHAPRPPTPSSSPELLSIASPFCPRPPSGTSHLSSVPTTVSVSPEVPHLKLVQRKPGKMGVAAPTGIGQRAYSSGTGSSGSCWSPHGAHPGYGRMEELEELEKGKLVKNSHPRHQLTSPQLPHILPLSFHWPLLQPLLGGMQKMVTDQTFAQTIYTQSFGGETCPTSHGGGELLGSVPVTHPVHRVPKFCCCDDSCFCLHCPARSQNSGRTRSLFPGGPAGAGTHSGRACCRAGTL